MREKREKTFNAERFKILVRESGMTKKELAKHVGVSASAICRYLNGYMEPSFSVFEKIVSFFECGAEYLMTPTNVCCYHEKKLNASRMENLEREIIKIVYDATADVSKKVIDAVVRELYE